MLLTIFLFGQDFATHYGKALTSPSVAITLALLFTWIGWRAWRFTICPYLHPHKVKELPYLVPYLGHSIAFFRDPSIVVESAARLANGGQDPFAIQVLRIKLYFLTNPSYVTEVFRNSTTLSWNKYLDKLLVCWGVRKDAVPMLHAENPRLEGLFTAVSNNPTQKKNLFNFADSVFRRQLAVDKVDELSSVFFDTLYRTVSRGQLEFGHHDHFTVRGLLDCTLTRAITRTFFGDIIFDLEPDITGHAISFSDGVWQLIYHYPRWLKPEYFASYERVMSAIERFTELSPAQMSQACFMIRSMAEAEKLTGLDKRSAAALTTIMYLAALSNVHATSFWLLCYIIFDKHLAAAIRAEIVPAFKNGQLDTNYIVQDCPLLESSFREVLRLHIVSYSVRLVEQPTHFGSKILEPDNILMVPSGRLHHNEAVWGSDHKKFDPRRFLHSKGKNLANNPSYRPFGGGTNMCPGKAFANRQVLSFVAFILYSYEVTVPDIGGKKQQMPLAEEDTPTFGTSVPKAGMDPVIELKSTSNEPIDSIRSWL